MNRVQVEIGANVTGFQQGMQAASQSAQQYETDMRKVSDSTVNFNQELRKAKKEVRDLAAGYAQLDAAAKNSAFGKEMKRQLDEAKSKAAEFIDMQGDLQQELRNLASDTHTLDMLSEGFGVIASSASTAMGVIAQFTGNEDDARKAVIAFTTAESALSAVTKIQNALQMQSNTMMAVTKVQTLAAAAATRIKTAAEGRGVLVTKAATAAQAAFNAVAMANPYVLLAAAIAGVCLAVGAYVLATQDAETETDRQNRKIEEAKKQWNEYKNKVAESAASQVADFITLQKEWEALKTTEEKNKFLDDNKNKFKAMGLEIDDVNELEKLFVKNSAAVCNALKARAEAEAWGEIYKQELIKKNKADLNGSVANGRYIRKAKAGDYISDDEARRANINNVVSYSGQTATTANMQGTYKRAITEQEAARVNALRMADAQKKLAEENANLKKIEDRLTDAVRAQGNAYAQLSTELTHSNKKKGGNGSDTKKELTELEKLENKVKELKKYQANIGKLNLSGPEKEKLVKETKDAIKKAEDEITKYKIAVGIEVEPSKLDKLEADLKEKELLLRADISQEEKDKVYKEILQLRDKIQKEKIAAHIIIDPQIEIDQKARQAVQDIVNSINVQQKPKWDFSNIAEVDPDQAKQLDKLVAQYNLVYDARERLMQLMNEGDASDSQIAAAQEALEEMGPLYDGILDKLNSFKDVDDAVGDSIKNMKKLQHTVGQVGDAIQSCADLFSALGEAGNDEGFAVMGIVAKAVATVALSYAQALASCKTWVDWLAFGVTGLATMISMISSIKQATEGGYANGGIVGGSSYSGDNLYARVNSGEMILNSRQQRNLFNLLDSDAMPQKGGTNVQVTGVIRGTDLLLVQKNTNKVKSKAGTQIHF